MHTQTSHSDIEQLPAEIGASWFETCSIPIKCFFVKLVRQWHSLKMSSFFFFFSRCHCKQKMALLQNSHHVNTSVMSHEPWWLFNTFMFTVHCSYCFVSVVQRIHITKKLLISKCLELRVLHSSVVAIERFTKLCVPLSFSFFLILSLSLFPFHFPSVSANIVWKEVKCTFCC